jgi:hypothetical protein
MATVSRETLRSRAKTLADMATSSFVSDDEWNQFLEDGRSALQGLLARASTPHPMAEEEYDFETDGTENVALPDDMLRATGVDLQVNGRWVEVTPFDWAQRNALRNVATSTGLGTQYALRGGYLKLLPVPPDGTSGRLNYVPGASPLGDDDAAMEGVNGWERYVCLFAAIEALDKEESDTSRLEAKLAKEEERVLREASRRDAENPSATRDVEDSAGFNERDEWPALRRRL